MLQHEQHILPVDLLFDDEQIGDFVKSIQIDSPYQQMLFEGVLTENVLNEKLYVSFTVEGYFHYVLGEVLEAKFSNLTANEIFEYIDNINLIGLLSLAVTHTLCDSLRFWTFDFFIKRWPLYA
jgi:hypothetical protein